MRILLIEDEKKTAAFIAKGLSEAGYAVRTARDGETGLELASNSSFDLMLVDVMLPEKGRVGGRRRIAREAGANADSFSHRARWHSGSGQRTGAWAPTIIW